MSGNTCQDCGPGEIHTTKSLHPFNPATKTIPAGSALYRAVLEKMLVELDEKIDGLREEETEIARAFATADSGDEPTLVELRARRDRQAEDWLDAWQTRRVLCRSIAKLSPVEGGVELELVDRALELAAERARAYADDQHGGDVRSYREANALDSYREKLYALDRLEAYFAKIEPVVERLKDASELGEDLEELVVELYPLVKGARS